MSYLVLARKLRPQCFEEIVGQEAVVKTLANSLSSGRIHHAFLFCGPRGTGKTTTARILAKALNCAEGPTPTPCNRCRACEEITGGTAVDVQEIDGASNTGVDDVRQLRENARYLPVTGRRKIYIIDEVHMLSVSAFNALLKTLEEPPPHVTFIFATTEAHKIPVTILSRCQRYDLGRVSPDRLIRMLAERLPPEGISIEPEGLSVLAQASEGSVRDALSLVDQVVSFAGAEAITAAQVREALGLSDRETLLALSEALLARDGAAALALLGRVFQGGQDLVHFSRAFLSHLRDLTVAALVEDPSGLIQATESDLAAIRDQVQGLDPLWLQQLFDRFAVSVDRVARSDSPRLVLEMALVGLVQAEPLMPLGDLLERLELLEAGATSAPPRGGGGAPRAPAPPGARGPARPGRTEMSGRAASGEAKAKAPQASAPTPAQAAGPASASPSGPERDAETEPQTQAQASDRASVLSGDPMQAWETLVKLAERHSSRLAANLYRASLLSLQQKGETLRVTIGLPRGSFELRQLQQDDSVGPLTIYLTRALGQTVHLSVTATDGESPPDVGAEARADDPDARRGAGSADAQDREPSREVAQAPSSQPAAPSQDGGLNPNDTAETPALGQSPEAATDGGSTAHTFHGPSADPPPRTKASPPLSPPAGLARSLLERDEQWRREERARKRKEALEHAAVRDAVEILEGEVEDIHVVVD